MINICEKKERFGVLNIEFGQSARFKGFKVGPRSQTPRVRYYLTPYVIMNLLDSSDKSCQMKASYLEVRNKTGFMAYKGFYQKTQVQLAQIYLVFWANSQDP